MSKNWRFDPRIEKLIGLDQCELIDMEDALGQRAKALESQLKTAGKSFPPRPEKVKYSFGPDEFQNIANLESHVAQLEVLQRLSVPTKAVPSPATGAEASQPSKPPATKLSASEVCRQVRLGKMSAEEANGILAEQKKLPAPPPANKKISASEICGQVRAGTMTSAEGNRILNKQRREELAARREIKHARGPLQE